MWEKRCWQRPGSVKSLFARRIHRAASEPPTGRFASFRVRCCFSCKDAPALVHKSHWCSMEEPKVSAMPNKHGKASSTEYVRTENKLTREMHVATESHECHRISVANIL